MSGDGLEDAVWLVDASLGRGRPDWRLATPPEFNLLPQTKPEEHGYLLTDILQRAWKDLSPEGDQMSDAEMRNLVTLDVPFYDVGDTIFPVMTYSEQTGFTRNLPEDLLEPFGTAKQYQ
jgi:hypothetical protein